MADRRTLALRLAVRTARRLSPGALAVLASCSGGVAPPPPLGGSFVPDAGTTSVVTAPLCPTARASEDLSPRADLTGLMSMANSGGTQVVKTSDLYLKFRASCGDCHVDAASGGMHADDKTFATVFDATWLAHIKSDDPSFYMPPPPRGKAYSTRDPSDPIVELVNYLEPWLAQGRPADMFTVQGIASAATGASYGFSPDVAAAMTNLGNCVPTPSMFANSTSGMMESMDSFFASATALPNNLADTDLTTFDSSVLAATGVVAYVPTYPLWSAGSGKLRHIRVPRGQTVKFDKATQSFDIPPNTRFYKTFFRKVVDKTGQLRNRKMETRLIVARPDTLMPDGTAQQNALFGTYLWSDDETTAVLANSRYRDGTGHADQVLVYETDELAYQNIVDNLVPGANLTATLASAVAKVPGLEQHYAVPGHLRCIQCHMGSPSKNFVLGFFPLQVARRANMTGGTYEPTGDDELTQLQRLIDYGVISGMASPDDVLPLEQSQGARHYRTVGELNAQAYMVGNCAHCHNPRGFPSVTKPELASQLIFMPSATDGGVFEFPLDRMSPVRSRGANGDIPIPYITPSLYDYPVTTPNLVRMDNGAIITTETGLRDPVELTWTPKFDQTVDQVNVGSCALDSNISRGYCGTRKTGPSYVPAPWRSLIYRNVDTPFPYIDDYVPFPHMPMNSAGFDCRAPRIMGEWMVGLPAARKTPNIAETVLPISATSKPNVDYDANPQPYVEVKPGDAAYADAVARAADRITQYKAGVRYQYCEDIFSSDIIDPVGAPEGAHRPDPTRFIFGDGLPVPDPRDKSIYLPVLGVPYHSHWFNYDPTDAPPPWSPRRPDWKMVITPGSQPDPSTSPGYPLQDSDIKYRANLMVALNDALLTDDLKKYATTAAPFALWQAKPECQQQLASTTNPAIKKVSDLTAPLPEWIVKTAPAATSPVFMSTPGEMLYRHICFNCHGPKKDGRGLQADALASASEGEARPANFREGLFGPSTQPGADLQAEFNIGTSGIDALGWGARYMAWMTLGGTLQIIPENIIRQVEATRIFGQVRPNLSLVSTGNAVSANMLTLAKDLCAAVLPDHNVYAGSYLTSMSYPPYNGDDAPFIETNGDKQMWIYLCSRFSPPVVRVYGPNKGGVKIIALYYGAGVAQPGDGYPSNAPVGDQNTDTTKVSQMGIQPETNFFPACLDPTTAADLVNTRAGHYLPACPAAFIANRKQLLWTDLQGTTEAEGATFELNITRWRLRGAISTGMTVFSYLQAGGAQTVLPPNYNECQLLPAP
jgi:mono/diheme cytochrome c family protein